jgi:hypothetical protein
MSSTLSSFGFDEDDFAPSILQAIEDAVSLPPMALCDSNVYDAVLCSAPLPPMLPSPSMGGFSFPGVACFPPVPPFLGHVSPQEIRPLSFFSSLVCARFPTIFICFHHSLFFMPVNGMFSQMQATSPVQRVPSAAPASRAVSRVPSISESPVPCKEDPSDEDSRGSRGVKRREPVRDDYDDEAEFTAAWTKWRRIRDNNNEAVGFLSCGSDFRSFSGSLSFVEVLSFLHRHLFLFVT